MNATMHVSNYLTRASTRVQLLGRARARALVRFNEKGWKNVYFRPVAT